MSLRVAQWATGSVGVAAIKGVLEHPELELVGCWVHSEAKSGMDVGDMIGTPALGVIATNSLDDILALDADAVIYAPLLPNVDEVTALLQSGKNVVTPVGWFYPGEKEAAPLEVAAQAGNATLHGAGIGPGAATELFPLLLSVMSTGVTFVRAEEFSDLRTYGAPDVLRYVMGFGGTPDKALTGPMQKILDGGFFQSVRLCVDRLGFAAEPEIRSSQEVAVATGPIDSPIGVIEPGQVAGRRFHWEALVGDTVVVRITVNWLMGEENLDPAWSFGPAGERYEIEVRGNPDTFVTVKGWQPESVEAGLKSNPGVVATAAHCVNAVPATCAAPSGIQSFLRPAADHRPGRPRAVAVTCPHGTHPGCPAIARHPGQRRRRLRRHLADTAHHDLQPLVRAHRADRRSPRSDRRMGDGRADPSGVAVPQRNVPRELTSVRPATVIRLRVDRRHRPIGIAGRPRRRRVALYPEW